MEEMVREIKSKLDEMEQLFTFFKKRLNKLCDESACQGDLCSCITFYKGTESRMKDFIRQTKAIENRMSEKDREDKERDRKINQLTRDIANLHSAETVTKSQNATSKINRVEQEQRRKASSPANNRSRQDSEINNSCKLGKIGDNNQIKQRLEEHDLHDKIFESDKETNDTSIKLELQKKAGEKQQYPRTLRQSPCPDNRYSDKYRPKNHLPTEKNFKYGSISKPNVKNSMEVVLSYQGSSAPASDTSIPRDDLPLVDRQMEKEYYLSPDVWEVEAKAERISSRKTSLRKLENVTTILLIDTSESMATGGTWHQVTTFVNEYIDGLEDMSTKHNVEEHLALVTFGAQTRCQQRYTNDLSLIRAAFNKLQLGGPSPLYGGLLMADSVALTCEKDLISLPNGILVYTKVILITDGEPTEICLHRGPDIPDPKQMDETKTMLLMLMEAMSSRALDLFCVPVGDANKDFLNLMFSKEGGRRILNYKDGEYFSKRLFLTAKLEVHRNLLFGIKYETPRHDPALTARDFAHMQELIEDAKTKNYEEIRRREENPYEEANNQRLLKPGSRVRRGPDWTNGVEDDEGPGTVVGHNLYRDKVWVQWDKTDEIRQYSYGDIGMYSVLPVDEPRILVPGQPLAVGCVVTTGKDWTSDEAPPGSKGVILRMGATQSGKRKAVVRWKNGKRTISSYGDDKIYEIILSMADSSVPEVTCSNTRPAIHHQQTDSYVPAVPRSQSRPAFPYHHERPAIQNRQPTVPSVASNTEITGQKQKQTKNKNKNTK